MTITVTLPPESELLLLEIAHKMPVLIPAAIARGLDRALQLVVGQIQRRRLSGTGPYPPSAHRLGTRTGILQRGMQAIPAFVRGDTVVGEIRGNVFYTDVHEFGMTIHGKPLMRFQIGPKWVSARKVVIPERGAVRAGILENVDIIRDEVVAEIEDTWNKLP